MTDIYPGLYEYNIQSFFEFFTTNCGLIHQAYQPIVGAGNHSAILHWQENSGLIGENDMLLLDAGAEFRGYAADITRTSPAKNSSSIQKFLLEKIEKIALECESMVKPLVKWSTINSHAYARVCEVLKEAGFLKGDLKSMIENQVCGLFYPHGLGHSVGIDVHDPGSISVLQENMVLTVEPGIYFNRAFVEIGEKNAKKSPFLNLPKIHDVLNVNIGGVRHENVLLVTKTGHQVLSVV